MKNDEPIYRHTPSRAAGNAVMSAIVAERGLPSGDAETIAGLVADANRIREKEGSRPTVTPDHVRRAMGALAGTAAAVASLSEQN